MGTFVMKELLDFRNFSGKHLWQNLFINPFHVNIPFLHLLDNTKVFWSLQGVIEIEHLREIG